MILTILLVVYVIGMFIWAESNEFFLDDTTMFDLIIELFLLLLWPLFAILMFIDCINHDYKEYANKNDTDKSVK